MSKKNSDARARFAQRLRSIRIPRGYKTARSFAEALDIDENRYTRYERAEVEPDLQLLMRICTLLGATPNDLLCDVIGAPRLEVEMPYGFSERRAAAYQEPPESQMQPHQHGGSGPNNVTGTVASSMVGARKAIGFELAGLIATIEARAAGSSGGNLSTLEKLHRIGPIAARIESDAFQFLSDLPQRLQGIQLTSEEQVQIERLMHELVIAYKGAFNDND